MKISPNFDLGLAILRIGGAGLLLTHGVPKFQRLLAGNMDFMDPIGIGSAPSFFLVVLAEFVCSILVIIGFKTRWACIPIIITMLVAAFIAHAADPFGVKEKPLLFALIFVGIFLMGPGKYSIDKK